MTRPLPVKVVGLTDAIAVDLSATAACAARKDGTVVCWGMDVFEPGELAHPVDVVDEGTR